MTNTIQLKRRNSSSAKPSSLAEGELGINTLTGKLYAGMNDSSIREIGGDSGFIQDEPNPAGACADLNTRVCVTAGSVKIYAFEDNTVVSKNNTVLLKMDAEEIQTITLAVGDTLQTNDKPLACVESRLALPPLACAAYKFVYRNPRSTYVYRTYRIYAPYQDAEVDIMENSDDFTTPTASVSVTKGSYIDVEINMADVTYIHYIQSTSPVIIVTAQDTTSKASLELNIADHTIVVPPSREVLGTVYSNFPATLVQGEVLNATSSIYWTSESPLASFGNGDGSGADAEFAMPVEWLGDNYCLPHVTDGFICSAIEPCTVKVYGLNSGTLLYTIDLEAASKTNPVAVSTGTVTGAGAALDTIGLRLEGTGRFYVRTNNATREYGVFGWNSKLRKTYANPVSNAASMYYDNTTSGGASTNAQDMLDDLQSATGGVLEINFASDADRTLTIAEGRHGTISVTDTSELLTQSRCLIFPDDLAFTNTRIYNGTEQELCLNFETPLPSDYIIYPGEFHHLSILAPVGFINVAPTLRELNQTYIYSITSDADVTLDTDIQSFHYLAIRDPNDILTTTRTIDFTTALFGIRTGIRIIHNQTNGAVATHSLNSGGTGYVAGETFGTTGSGSNLVIRVDTVDGSGTILTYTVLNPGWGYTVQSVGTFGGSGSGFSLSIDSVTTGNPITVSGGPGLSITLDPGEYKSVIDYGGDSLIFAPAAEDITNFDTFLNNGLLGPANSANLEEYIQDIDRASSPAFVSFPSDADLTLTAEQSRAGYLIIADLGGNLTQGRTISWDANVNIPAQHVLNFTGYAHNIKIAGQTANNKIYPLQSYGFTRLGGQNDFTSMGCNPDWSVGRVTVNFTSDANLTLTAGETSCHQLEITDTGGNLTTGRDVIIYSNIFFKGAAMQVVTNSTAQVIRYRFTGGDTYLQPGEQKVVIYDSTINEVVALPIAQEQITTKTKQIASTSYTITDADHGWALEFTAGTTVTVTVNNGLRENFECLLIQDGAGQVQLTGSATLRNRNSHTNLAGQYASASLYMYKTNVLLFQGDTA